MLLRDREKRQWDSTFGREDNEFVQKIVIFLKPRQNVQREVSRMC